MSPHVADEQLALHAEDLLEPAEAEAVSEHLAGCSECRLTVAELGQIPALLAEGPLTPMPAAVAGRIDAALAEAAGATKPPSITAPNVVVQLRKRRRFAGYGMAAAAAAVIIVGGGLVLTSHGGGGSNLSGSAARSPAKGLEHPQAARVAIPVHQSGTAYQQGLLAAQARNLTRPGSTPMFTPSGGASATSNLSTPDVSMVRACAAPLVAGMSAVADLATYDGRRAVIIVAPADARVPRTVWVLGFPCDPAHPDQLAKVTVPGS